MDWNVSNKRVLVYARFSSQLQRDASIEDQVRVVRAAANLRGGASARSVRVLDDKGISGASLQRPAFEEMMRLAERHEIDIILTEDVSRITRDLADAAALFKRLAYLGIPLIGVSDGINTSAPNSKMHFGMKALMNEAYLDDLSSKTSRGLHGRAIAGLSTGGLPLGYRSSAVIGADGREVGYRVAIDESGAATVRRIFDEYLAGRSLESIAHTLNAESVPTARTKMRYRRKGWVASSVRAILHNESYVGRWTYNRRQWLKLPGTNIRRPRTKPEGEHIRKEFPERRIIDEDVWQATQARLAAVRNRYTKTTDGRLKAAAATGQRNSYVLSGLLRCGLCGAPMIIHAGTSCHYYRCADQKKRGTCSNKLSLREDVAKRRFIEALRDRYARPSAVTYLRGKIAEHLGAASRGLKRELEEARARLSRTKERIAGLVRFISEGDHSLTVRQALLDLEAQRRAEEAAIATLCEDVAAPVVLPTPDDVMVSTAGLEQVMAADPLRAREQLRSLFAEGRLLLHPQPEGFYIAEGRIDVLAFLTLRFDEPRASGPGTTKARSPFFGTPGHRIGPDHLWSSHGCAGRI